MEFGSTSTGGCFDLVGPSASSESDEESSEASSEAESEEEEDESELDLLSSTFSPSFAGC